MFNKILATFFTLSICAIAETKYVYDYLAHIEPLVKEGRFEDAKVEFSKINPVEVKHKAAGGFFASLRYLEGDDQRKRGAFTYRKALGQALQHPEECKLAGKYGIYCEIPIFDNDVTQTPPEDMPFSPEFRKYIYDEYYKKNIEMYNQVRSILLEREKREEQLALEVQKKKEEERKEARQIAKEKRELEAQKEQALLDQEIQMIDQTCKSSGYKGLAKHKDTPLDMISMLYITQREGELENYINTVVGNLKNDKNSLHKVYPKVKAFQVLEDGVLYTYSEYDSEGGFSTTVYVKKEDGKLYQEGQSLEDTFYVFNGMYTYITTAGARKTIPSFSKAKINRAIESHDCKEL